MFSIDHAELQNSSGCFADRLFHPSADSALACLQPEDLASELTRDASLV
jgi:hypothetical protein